MDTTKFSLNDIFALLNESVQLLGSRQITVISGEEGDVKTNMSLAEYIAMSVATELTSTQSRLAGSEPMAKKIDVEAAMKANYWDEVCYPNYTYPGLIMGGGKRSATRIALRIATRIATRKGSRKQRHFK